MTPLASQIDLTGARVGQDVLVDVTGLRSLQADTAEIGGELRFRAAATPKEPLSLQLNGVTVGSTLRMKQLKLGEISARGLKVGGDIVLDELVVADRVELDHATVGGRFSIREVSYERDALDGSGLPKALNPSLIEDRPNVPSLYLNAVQVAGVLKVRNFGKGARREDRLVGGQHSPGAPRIAEEGAPASGARKSRHPAVPHASLIHASIGQIDDIAGSQWNDGMWLRLNGLTYGSIYYNEREGPQDENPRQAENRRDVATTAVPLLIVLAVILAAAALLGGYGTIDWLVPVRHWTAVLAIITLWLAKIISDACPPVLAPRVESRINWLRQQHAAETDMMIDRDYHPQPFIQLARTYRQQGLFEFSDAVLERRVRLEVTVKGKRLRRGPYRSRRILRRVQAWLMNCSWISSSTLYRVFFAYGLKPQTAIITFGLFWLTGAVAADWMMGNGLLRLDQDAGRSRQIGTVAVDPAPCQAVVSPFVYAADVFVPLLDLQAERRCTVPERLTPLAEEPQATADLRPAAHLALAIYGFLGWIVTSLTILTLTGILRRFVEN